MCQSAGSHEWSQDTSAHHSFLCVLPVLLPTTIEVGCNTLGSIATEHGIQQTFIARHDTKITSLQCTATEHAYAVTTATEQ